MRMTNIVFEQAIDDTMLEHIYTMRETRLGLAQKMLSDLDVTAQQLKDRGILDNPDLEELRIELSDRVATMQERMEHPGFIFDDEIALYTDMLAEGAPKV